VNHWPMSVPEVAEEVEEAEEAEMAEVQRCGAEVQLQLQLQGCRGAEVQIQPPNYNVNWGVDS